MGMPRAELGASPPEALRLGIEDTSRFPYRLYRLLCLPTCYEAPSSFALSTRWEPTALPAEPGEDL